MELRERIKLIEYHLNITHKELADLLGVRENRIKQLSAGNIKALKPNEVLILAQQYGFNQNWLLTGVGEMLAKNTVNYSPKLSQTIEDALSEIEEPELIEFIKEKTVAKIVGKLSMPKNLLSKAFNFLTYERPLIYLYLVFKSIKPYDDSIGHKERIIKSISELDLLSFQNILGPAFNSYSKNHMIKRVEDLTEDECRVLLENIPQLQKHLEKKHIHIQYSKETIRFLK
jgi:transcriptional regulator with XRE-family HTH domain